ncbi:lipopolysaccharide biosynthesis protein [Azohydromonas aeria]|uniref:lipopolysaccharide biosynthesis protein n=1 Tax=Azohydromonas aeria TaxID=2590212 RepID=UPI0012F77213|nr:oligosaccharide flippase family protein [Azohydromonas aeria]
MKFGKQLTHLGLYLSFSLSGAALSFGAVLILTRVLPTEEYGAIGIFFSILYLVAPAVSLAADGLVSVNKSRLDPKQYLEFQRTYVTIAFASFLVFQTGFVLAWLAKLYTMPLLAFVPAYALIRFLSAMAAAESVIDEKPWLYGLIAVLTPASALAMTAMLVFTLGGYAVYRILATFLAEALVVFFRYRTHLIHFVALRFDRATARQIFRFGLPSLVALTGGWALNESDKIIIAREAGLDVAGIYTAAASLAAIMMTLNQSVTNALYPEMFRRLKTGQQLRQVIIRYVASFVGISSLLCLAVISAYLLVRDIVLPERYADTKPFFIALALAGVAVSFYRPFGLAAEYFQLARTRAIAILLGGATTLLVSTVGVRHGNALWAPAGIAAGYLMAAFVVASGLKMREKNHSNTQ